MSPGIDAVELAVLVAPEGAASCAGVPGAGGDATAPPSLPGTGFVGAGTLVFAGAGVVPDAGGCPTAMRVRAEAAGGCWVVATDGGCWVVAGAGAGGVVDGAAGEGLATGDGADPWAFVGGGAAATVVVEPPGDVPPDVACVPAVAASAVPWEAEVLGVGGLWIAAVRAAGAASELVAAGVARVCKAVRLAPDPDCPRERSEGAESSATRGAWTLDASGTAAVFAGGTLVAPPVGAAT